MLPKSGILTSPNYPQSYPSSHDSSQAIRVAEGNTIQIHFTEFDTERKYDYVEINDGDGTILLHKESGSWGGPEDIVTNTNEAFVKFHTDITTQRKGWRLEWSERQSRSTTISGDAAEIFFSSKAETTNLKTCVSKLKTD